MSAIQFAADAHVTEPDTALAESSIEAAEVGVKLLTLVNVLSSWSRMFSQFTGVAAVGWLHLTVNQAGVSLS